MKQITKEQVMYIREKVKSPYIVICSKRKRGSKGNRISGKTYYCPESRAYEKLLKDFEVSYAAGVL